MSSDPKKVYDDIVRMAAGLPEQGKDAVETAAHHLEMLHYQNLVDFTGKDFLRLTNQEFLAELDRVMKMSPRELGVTATVIEDWTDGAASAEANRAKRLEFMFKEYGKLCRLRANDPEAWDEINELYFDD